MTEIQPFPRLEMTDAELEQQWCEQTKKRQQMKKALGSVMTPVLRKAGFTGTCPRLRRLNPDRYDLFMFDFCRGHDGFSIQVGQCAPDDIGYPPLGEQPVEFLKIVPLEKLYPEHLRLEQRARVQPRHGVLPGDFFEYGDAKTAEDYKHVALSAVPFVESTIAGFEDFARFAKSERLDKR
jgi:hypothetical protein